MEVIVASKHLAVDVSFMPDVTGRDHLVVVAKSTWRIPQAGQRARPLPPLAIEQADLFVGDPGASALLYGGDTARYKPRCDVLFNASAHAPDGLPVAELGVAWQVGALRKALRVHGARQWRKRFGMVSHTPAQPFTTMPLHFGLAFGGARSYQKGRGEQAQLLSESHPVNPAGIGWFGSHADDEIDGQAAPCLEALDEPVRKPNGKQAPVAFSAIARHWHPRAGFSGTYDEQWRADVFPFLPDDFDEQFNQCAPQDQQMAYPVGGEQVVLHNMMAGCPDVRFKLPKLDGLKLRILRADYSTEEPLIVPDTLYFETDEARFSVVWRASVPVRRRLQEFTTVAVGPVSAQWWRDKSLGLDSCAGCDGPGSALAEPEMSDE